MMLSFFKNCSWINLSSNISTIHWYHRKRATKQNRKDDGKAVGTGT